MLKKSRGAKGGQWGSAAGPGRKHALGAGQPRGLVTWDRWLQIGATTPMSRPAKKGTLPLGERAQRLKIHVSPVSIFTAPRSYQPRTVRIQFSHFNPEKTPKTTYTPFHQQRSEFLLRFGGCLGVQRHPFDCLARPASSSTVIRATKLPLRRHRPRIACLRLSRTLVYLYSVNLNLNQFDCSALPCVSYGNTVASVKLAQQISHNLL